MAAYQLSVDVTPQYLPEQSSPADGIYAFSYTVLIRNTGSTGIQVVSRRPSARRARRSSPWGRAASTRARTSRARTGATPPVAIPTTTPSRSIRAGVWKSLNPG